MVIEFIAALAFALAIANEWMSKGGLSVSISHGLRISCKGLVGDDSLGCPLALIASLAFWRASRTIYLGVAISWYGERVFACGVACELGSSMRRVGSLSDAGCWCVSAGVSSGIVIGSLAPMSRLG